MTPTPTEDRHLFDIAAKWNAQKGAESQRRHEGMMKALKWVLLACTLVGVLAVTCAPLSDTYNRWRDRVAAENKLADEQAAKQAHFVWAEEQAIKAGRVNRQAERDLHWETCVQTMGLDACQAIEERAFKSCWFGNGETIIACVKKRLEE